MKILIFSRHEVNELTINAQSHTHVNMLFTHILLLLGLLLLCDTIPMTRTRLPRHLYHEYFISGVRCTPQACWIICRSFVIAFSS